MDTQNAEALDMNVELFIPPRLRMDFLIPPKPESYYRQQLASGADLAKKTEAMFALIHLFRGKAAQNASKYTEAIAAEIAGIFRQNATSPELAICAAEKLMGEGGHCEGVGDYQGGAWFYRASLDFKVKDPEFVFFQHNNLGFCLNFLKQFQEAEVYLRAATELDPGKYNAWKNLGVSLEHQGKHADAVACYMKAVNRSHGEKRSVKHLMRLISRHPELRQILQVVAYLDFLAKHGFIEKVGQA